MPETPGFNLRLHGNATQYYTDRGPLRHVNQRSSTYYRCPWSPPIPGGGPPKPIGPPIPGPGLGPPCCMDGGGNPADPGGGIWKFGGGNAPGGGKGIPAGKFGGPPPVGLLALGGKGGMGNGGMPRPPGAREG
jgi:hypothetical protein